MGNRDHKTTSLLLGRGDGGGGGGAFKYPVGVALGISGGGVIIWQALCDVQSLERDGGEDLGWNFHQNAQSWPPQLSKDSTEEAASLWGLYTSVCLLALETFKIPRSGRNYTKIEERVKSS